MIAYKITTLSTGEHFFIVAKNVGEAASLAKNHVDKFYKIASIEFAGEVYEITEECANQRKIKPYVPDINELNKSTRENNAS